MREDVLSGVVESRSAVIEVVWPGVHAAINYIFIQKENLTLIFVFSAFIIKSLSSYSLLYVCLGRNTHLHLQLKRPRSRTLHSQASWLSHHLLTRKVRHHACPYAHQPLASADQRTDPWRARTWRPWGKSIKPDHSWGKQSQRSAVRVRSVEDHSWRWPSSFQGGEGNGSNIRLPQRDKWWKHNSSPFLGRRFPLHPVPRDQILIVQSWCAQYPWIYPVSSTKIKLRLPSCDDEETTPPILLLSRMFPLSPTGCLALSLRTFTCVLCQTACPLQLQCSHCFHTLKWFCRLDVVPQEQCSRQQVEGIWPSWNIDRCIFLGLDFWTSRRGRDTWRNIA